MARYSLCTLLAALLALGAVSLGHAPQGARVPGKEDLNTLGDAPQEARDPGKEDLSTLGHAPQGARVPGKEDLNTLVEGNNAFAFDLYARLGQKPGNVVFSPYSISNALAMTYGGARGETALQMARVLHFTLPEERLHAGFAALIGQLQEQNKDRRYQLSVANALWGQKGYPFLDAFLRLGRDNYRAGLQELDFGNETEKARQTINRWVEEQTKDKIKELLAPNDLSPQVRLVLTNAIYFKAAWRTPFLKEETKDALFEVTPTEKIPVTMMHTQDAPFKYLAADDCQWLELPYAGGRLSMILLLPKQGRLADLEKTLTAAKIQQGVGKLKFHDGTVALPRFKVSAAARLKDELGALGMPLAFSDGADFSGMDGGGGLRISNVIHQAYLSVDEFGSEAAAATAVTMLFSNYPPFSFTANRPFLFLIRDNQTASTLFLGRVVRPGKVS